MLYCESQVANHPICSKNLEKAKEALSKVQAAMGVAERARAQVDLPHPTPLKKANVLVAHNSSVTPRCKE